MDIESTEQTMQELCEASAIMKGLEDVKAGRTVDGESAIRAVREKYGIGVGNAAYLKKLERGLAQVHAGQGIVRSMEELEAMADDGE